MKLSDLVAYRNELNRFDLSKVKQDFDLSVAHTRHIVNHKDEDPTALKQLLLNKYNNVHNAFGELISAVELAKQEADQEIKEKEKFWLDETYKLYRDEMVHDSDEHILNRRPTLKQDQIDIIQNRIVGASNSRRPGMIIRPGLENHIKNMVSFDPLYLVDRNENMLFPSTFEFPDLYQRRLRRYIVDEYDSLPILEKLPNNQFAVCLAYNFFNFKPIPVIERYLTEIFDKLCPGGRILMTFNDCDNEKAVRLAEQYYACYTPGRMVKEIAQRIGYEIYFIYNDNEPWTWIELQKPGTVTSLRGGQALVKIVHKT